MSNTKQNEQNEQPNNEQINNENKEEQNETVDTLYFLNYHEHDPASSYHHSHDDIYIYM
jgi:hypothetical protein